MPPCWHGQFNTEPRPKKGRGANKTLALKSGAVEGRGQWSGGCVLFTSLFLRSWHVFTFQTLPDVLAPPPGPLSFHSLAHLVPGVVGTGVVDTGVGVVGTGVVGEVGVVGVAGD